MSGGWKFSALKSTSKIALWVTLQAENLPDPGIYRIFSACKMTYTPVLEFRMLDSYFCSGRREVEHIENDGFGAAVLAPMDSADDFNKSFAFMEGFLCSILANDG